MHQHTRDEGRQKQPGTEAYYTLFVLFCLNTGSKTPELIGTASSMVMTHGFCGEGIAEILVKVSVRENNFQEIYYTA